jgi:pyruvate dehydrogenase E2 component (dihydrolipoyllysine-residue acetyltransferase)
MATDVLMPKLSDTMEEGKILKWLKQPGDTVRQGDILAEVETDKADMELESFDEGVVEKITVPEGASAPVGAVIAVLGDARAAAGAPPAAAAETQAPSSERQAPAAAPAPAAPAQPAVRPPQAAPAAAKAAPPRRPAAAPEPAGDGGRVKASPLAKKVAAERGVDLRSMTGSGPGGRIVRKDVEAERAEPTSRPDASAPRPAAEPGASRHVELSRIRRTTAKRMAEAKREVPHFYASADVAMDDAVRLRDDLVALGGELAALTLTHVVVKACALALRRVPAMNASLDGDAVAEHAHVNVGIATATDDGLLVPVVHDADALTLAEVARTAHGLVDRARAGKPARDDLSGATFTISNLGMFPVSHFAAVVNPPQAAILAVGTVRDVPVVRDGVVRAGRVMTVTLSCDHRVVDGALAGRFLGELKAILEHPLALVV